MGDDDTKGFFISMPGEREEEAGTDNPRSIRGDNVNAVEPFRCISRMRLYPLSMDMKCSMSSLLSN